jgi:tetratricopeptide (TPR) repeat protein
MAALAALLATAGAAATPATPRPAGHDVEPASPLVAFAATLDAATPPGQQGRLADLRTIEAALARTPSPDDGCSQSLGAARFGALHARLAVARQGLGDRRGAMDAWRRALDCEPRNPRHHVALGSLLLTFGDLEGTRAQVERASRLDPRQNGLEELQARLAFVAGDWPEATAGALRVATRLEGWTPGGAAATPDDDEGTTRDPATGDASEGDEVAAFWRLLALLAQRRSGSPLQDAQAPDLEPENRWPAPLWRHVLGSLDERGIVAVIETQDALRQREMTCEALYYTAQLAFANGRHDDGRGRLARVVNLKVLDYVEHDMALAELAVLRRP